MAAIFGGKKEKKSKSVTAIEEILDEADNHLKEGETDKAASEYRRAHRYLYREENLAEAPEDFADLFTRTGHGLFETGEPDRAVECFDKATQLNPKNTDAWMSRGIVHLKTETMLNFAIMCFEEVLKVEPNNLEALENQAEALVLSDKTDKAVDIYKKLMELAPENEEYKNKLNELEPVTLESVTAKLKKSPKDVNLWKIRAKILEDDGQTAKAIESYLRVGYLEKSPEAYEKVLELNPRNKTALDKLIKFRPEDVELLERKGDILLAEDQKEGALEIYQKLAELDPGNEDYKTKLKGLKPDEMEEIEKVLATDPNNVEALAKKAAILESRSDPGAGDIYLKLVKLQPENAAHYEGALRYKPDDIGLLGTKGELHFDKGEFDKALACYDRIAQLRPKDAEALHNKGAALFKLEKYDESVATFDMIIAINPDDTIAYLTKGAALFKSGDIDPAVEALNNVVKRDPEEAAAWYYKSCAEAKKGNLKPVIPFLTRAIDMEEDFRERARTDECFAPVRDTPEFRALFE